MERLPLHFPVECTLAPCHLSARTLLSPVNSMPVWAIAIIDSSSYQHRTPPAVVTTHVCEKPHDKSVMVPVFAASVVVDMTLASVVEPIPSCPLAANNQHKSVHIVVMKHAMHSSTTQQCYANKSKYPYDRPCR